MSRHIFAEYLLSRARTESVSVQNWGGNQRSAFHRPASNSGQSASGPEAVIKCRFTKRLIPTPFQSFELIGWNIKADCLQTPRHSDIPSLKSSRHKRTFNLGQQPS